MSLLIVLVSCIYCLNGQNLIWAESSRISEKVNCTIVNYTERLGDNGTVVLVNVPVEEGYKGIECMPVMSPEYFRCQYNFKDVKVIFITKEEGAILSWWTRLKKHNPNVVGFVCDGDIESLRALP